jgi:dienelactone hydrolase
MGAMSTPHGGTGGPGTIGTAYRVADIPAVVVHPDPAAANGCLALWMHWLGGTKEAMLPGLQQLADRGFTAVSLDAWQHGERRLEPTRELMAGVFGEFRARMWPILGRTVLDAVAVVDDAVQTFDLDGDVVAGGVSMGGDLAVALAGIDTRVTRVAAVVATPDWTRPGMAALDDAHEVIEQGRPTRLGQHLFDVLDPSTHLERYRARPEITFDLGGDDRHIPRQNAEAFRDALVALDPEAGRRVRIRVHDGLDHLAAARDPEVLGEALGALTTTR